MNGRTRFRVGIGSVFGAVALLAGCGDFLDVSDPGRYTDDALNTPIALRAVANGVESDVMTNVDNLAIFSGLMSDEYMHTGTWQQWDDMDKGRIAAAIGTDNGLNSSLLQRRTAAQQAQVRFATVMGDSANRTELMARVVAAEGWSNLLIGMEVCENPKEPAGQIVSDIELFKLAIPIMTRAVDIAKAAGSTTYERFALAGRARANLYAGNLDAALADAQQIPDAFVFVAKFSSNGPNNEIVTLSHASRNKAGGLQNKFWSQVDTIAGFLKDPWTGALDKRVPITHPGNSRGVDGVTQHYNEEKYKNIDDDINMTSGWEMRLIEAEVYMKKNNLPQAMTLINKVRANAGLTAVTATTAADVQKYLLWERFAQLFLEGHRMQDLYRFGLTGQEVGTGRPTKFAMDTGELNLNPNTLGKTEGRCPAKS